MNKLDVARQIINEVDKKMADLFCERMKAAEMVAEYKKEKGLPVYDAVREEAIIQNNSQKLANPDYTSYYVNFLRDVMKISRSYQHKLLDGMKIAYSGVEGAFAHIAAGKIFTSGTRVAYPNFSEAYRAVVDGECDCAVLPIENSSAGEVGNVIDLIFAGSLYVNGVYELSVSQNLIGVPDSTVAEIKKVVSHIQALEQCDAYIKQHGFEVSMCDNTAIAAQKVAEMGDRSVAAIASTETAELYGLTVLDSNINESHVNTTRFAVLSRSEHFKTVNKPDNHSILMFTVRNEAGFLAKAINVIGEHGFNMRNLRSRSMKELLWQYYFYVEVEGNVNTAEGQKMLEDLSKYCDKLKVVGSFYNHIDLK